MQPGRIALIAIATIGLTVAAAPSVAASSAKDPNCYQVYLFEESVGPVTIDASDSCPEIYVNEDYCQADDGDAPVISEECENKIEEATGCEYHGPRVHGPWIQCDTSQDPTLPCEVETSPVTETCNLDDKIDLPPLDCLYGLCTVPPS